MHQRPKEKNPSMMLDSAWKELAPEVFVDLGTLRLREVHVPFNAECATCVIESQEVNDGKQPASETPKRNAPKYLDFFKLNRIRIALTLTSLLHTPRLAVFLESEKQYGLFLLISFSICCDRRILDGFPHTRSLCDSPAW